jgi:hypothetical protein
MLACKMHICQHLHPFVHAISCGRTPRTPFPIPLFVRRLAVEPLTSPSPSLGRHGGTNGTALALTWMPSPSLATVTTLAWSPDGGLLATGSRGVPGFCVWEVATGSCTSLRVRLLGRGGARGGVKDGTVCYIYVCLDVYIYIPSYISVWMYIYIYTLSAFNGFQT